MVGEQGCPSEWHSVSVQSGLSLIHFSHLQLSAVSQPGEAADTSPYYSLLCVIAFQWLFHD